MNWEDLFKPSYNLIYSAHSLIIKKKTVSGTPLEIVAETKEGEIMGVKHRSHDTWGVQFHPESILTGEGKKILKNFLELKK